MRAPQPFAGLPITGDYKVEVAMSGFASAEVTGLTLRAGETAAVKVKLLASGGQTEVTVYGTTEGVRVRSADRITTRKPTHKRNPYSRSKGFHAAAAELSVPAKARAQGDLFVNQTYFIAGVGSRRATTILLDGASNDEGWGRQTAVATIPMGAVSRIQCNDQRVLFRIRMDVWSGPKYRHEVWHKRVSR
jgi:hypothetical protein